MPLKDPGSRDPRAVAPARRWFSLLLLILALDLIVTWVHPNADPPRGYSLDHALITDGFWYLAEARGWILGQESDVADTYRRPLISWPAAACFGLAGVSLPSSRTLSSVASIGTLVLLALLLRRRHGAWVGLLGALVLAVCPTWHAHVRSTVIYPVVAFWFLAALAIAAGRSWCRWILGGIAIAIGAVLLKSILWLAAPAWLLEGWHRYRTRTDHQRRSWKPWAVLATMGGIGIALGGPWMQPEFWDRVAWYTGWKTTGPLELLGGFEKRSLLFSSLPVILPIYWVSAYLFYTRAIPVARVGRSFDRMAHLSILGGLPIFAISQYTPPRYLLIYLPLMVYASATLVAAARAYPRGRRIGKTTTRATAIRVGFALGTAYIATQCWQAHDNVELPWTAGILASSLGGLGLWVWTFSRRPVRRTRGAALVTSSFLLLILPGLPRLRPMFISPEYTISRTGKQIAGLVEPDSLLFGNFAHALTAATRLRAQHLFKVRYGDGQLEQSFAELGTTHLIFDCDDSSPIPEVFAQQGLPLEELDRYYIQGTEVRLFRLGGIAASRSPYETALQALRNEELDRAEKLFTECLAQNPRSAATWHQLGIVALRRGDGERGYKCLIEAIVHDPTRVHAHRDTAKLLAQNGHHTQALAHLRAAMAVTPGDEGLARQVAGIENELGRAHAQGDSRE